MPVYRPQGKTPEELEKLLSKKVEVLPSDLNVGDHIAVVRDSTIHSVSPKGEELLTHEYKNYYIRGGLVHSLDPLQIKVHAGYGKIITLNNGDHTEMLKSGAKKRVNINVKLYMWPEDLIKKETEISKEVYEKAMEKKAAEKIKRNEESRRKRNGGKLTKAQKPRRPKEVLEAEKQKQASYIKIREENEKLGKPFALIPLKAGDVRRRKGDYSDEEWAAHKKAQRKAIYEGKKEEMKKASLERYYKKKAEAKAKKEADNARFEELKKEMERLKKAL